MCVCSILHNPLNFHRPHLLLKQVCGRYYNFLRTGIIYSTVQPYHSNQLKVINGAVIKNFK